MKFFIIFFILLSLYADDIKLEKLIRAYPYFLDSITDKHIVFKDGSKMIIDDGLTNKDFKMLLSNPSLLDQLRQRYPKDDFSQPKINFDPGRIRYEPFFRKMYGETEKEVLSHLVKIKWMPKSTNKILYVSSINGVDKKLKFISNELDLLPNGLKKYVVNPSGVFNYRFISGTKRLSAHSFGIAIDINIKYANYWKWDKSKTDKKLIYKNQVPMEIVKIFEKYGFIWGGKWYHYDTMHFEYRPELLNF